jgi:serine kinase of HPr protein (carbohydrate metabolism regulator)
MLPPAMHGTCVARGGYGVLLRGVSGSGKSDLALRLIHAGWQLVADDYVHVLPAQPRPQAVVPPRLSGLLEVRGVGIVALPAAMVLAGQVPIACVIDLVLRAQVPRLPDPQQTVALAGMPVRAFYMHSFDESSVVKVAMVLDVVLGNTHVLTDEISPIL